MKKVLLAIFLLMSALLAYQVAAADFTVTLVKPAASETGVSGNYTLNATSNTTIANCSFYAMSASTANSTFVLLGSNTTSGTVFTLEYNTTFLQDSNDYRFRAICHNETDTVTVTNSNIEIDNTVPVAPTTPSPADKATTTDSTVTFSATVDDWTTTGCTLYFVGGNPGNPSYSMNYASGSCSVALPMPRQTYYWYVVASDGTNTTQSSTWNVQTKSSSSSTGGTAAYLDQLAQEGQIEHIGGGEYVQTEPKVSTLIGSTTMFGYDLKTFLGVPIIIWIILIGLAGWIYYNKNK